LAVGRDIRVKRMAAQEAAAAAPATAISRDTYQQLFAVARTGKASGTIKHYETVKKQFLEFLGGRSATPQLYADFMVLGMESKKKDGTPAYAPTSLWSRRTHLLDYFKELQIEIPQAVDDPVQSAPSSLGRTYVAKSPQL